MMRSHLCFAIVCATVLAACSGCADLPPPAAAAENATQVQADPPPATAEQPPHYIGRLSCAVTGCHGHNSLTPISWSNAHQLWDSTDPHRWAFDVLYTERSYKIYEKLEQPASEIVDKSTYLVFLQQKCIGCHATPPVGTELTSAGTPARFTATDPDAFSQGVSCESCHGAASDWEGRHFLKSWQQLDADPAGRARLTAKHHLHDLRPLDSRAAVCAKCHVGPQVIGEGSNAIAYDVNHDLIAAGHPRLNFEFNAYLTNLPKHWDEEAVWQKLDRPKPAAFHFEAWRSGQIQKHSQVAALQTVRPQVRWAEFANQDCRDCHHALGEPRYARTQNQPPDLKKLMLIGSAGNQQRAEFLLAYTAPTRFDEAVDVYLAATALAQDWNAPALDKSVEELRLALQAQAGSNQYTLPGKFDPEQTRPAFESLKAALGAVK